MAQGRIRLVSTIPGPANLRAIVQDFFRRDGGIVSAFSESAIRTLKSFLHEDSGAEAMPFGGVVRRFATLCGEMPMQIAQKGQTVAAIGAACESLPDDSPFQRTAHRLGLHRAISDTLHEMGAAGLAPDDYKDLNVSPALGAKLRSMGYIEEEAAETLNQVGRTFGREHLRLCLDAEPEKGAELGRLLLIADAFQPAALELIRWAEKQGCKVTVVIYRHATTGELFGASQKTAAALGLEPELVGKGDPLLDALFTAGTRGSHLKCTIASSPDPLAECEWALRTCLERKNQGTRLDELAIYVRDVESYAPLLLAAGKRLGVPLRVSRRAQLLTNSFARLTLATLEACVSPDVRSLLPVFRSSYFAFSIDERNELEAAIRGAHGDRGAQWNSLASWVALQLSAEEPRAFLKPTSAVLEWRHNALANPQDLAGWVGSLRDLMTLLPPGSGERDSRAQFVLHSSISTIASIRRLRGGRSLSLSEFVARASELWEEADVSVPPDEQGVAVATHADALPQVQTLFVLGMLEGVFPRRRSEDPVLSDGEREELMALTGKVLPVSREKAEAERDEFYMLCACPAEEIVLSYPETDEDRDNVPAFYLEEIERAHGSCGHETYSRQNVTPPSQDCASLNDRKIAEALEQPEREQPLPLHFSNEFTHTAFAVSRDSGLSPRELREALACPFSYFAKRRLEVTPTRLRTRWFSLASLPVKADTLGAEMPEEARTRLEGALENQLDTMVAELPDWEVSILRSGGRRLIGEWVQREFEARQLWPRDAGSLRSPLHFGDEGVRENLGSMVKLRGTVAGKSKAGPYSVLHLVESSLPETGHEGFSDQDTLYFGIHLLAIHTQGTPSALEVESMSGERLLMLLPRVAGHPLSARVQDGLKVLNLTDQEETGGVREFLEEVKKHLVEAVNRIENADVRALKGDHCAFCDYGELCRGSQDFGEEDSPFAHLV